MIHALLTLIAGLFHGLGGSLADDPYIVVLGTAQDGGMPQIGCFDPCCQQVREGEVEGRLVTSLLVADPASGKRWLLDASPDVTQQIDVARSHPPTRQTTGSRPELFDGVFLTHAHIGHYLGLAQFGPEAYGARHLPVYGTNSMHAFLQNNAPWDWLVKTQSIELHLLTEHEPVSLTHELSITPILVPHRREYTDTCAFVIRGPQQSVLYLPDIDKWERWEVPVEEVIASVDVALLDGTFFADGEIPGRSMSEIPHPFIVESLQRFERLPEKERAKVVFTHLNHTNPAADPKSAAAQRVKESGMRIATERMVIGL